jgi:hypothetical protein
MKWVSGKFTFMKKLYEKWVSGRAKRQGGRAPSPPRHHRQADDLGVRVQQRGPRPAALVLEVQHLRDLWVGGDRPAWARAAPSSRRTPLWLT